MALAGLTDKLIDKIDLLFHSESVQKHNDYYIYLVGMNYICIAIIMGNFNIAQKIYNKLNTMIPAICINEEYIIKKRYSIYNEIIINQKVELTDFNSLEKYFQTNLVDVISDYARKPYILTDQQFWSVI